MSAAAGAQPSTKKPGRGDMARSMALTIQAAARGSGAYGLGEVAALRRLEPTSPPGTFWKMFGGLLADVPNERIPRWALLAKGMAVLGSSCQDRDVAPGAALSIAGFSTSDHVRLDRLCSSDGEVFEDLFLAACRQMAQKAQALDWGRFAGFALALTKKDRDEETLRLLRDFYAPRRNPDASQKGTADA